ncbi:ATP-binding cassette domain-containing protein [Clostridium sp. MB40-C1]|uniref:ABC transporter ATP-binding protein n=1 Tax=Clostridium sp. MB40-C1 TaxID=3070996 RepID=UPI0027E091C4|nr:ATP-binding cassette domain-containing protein [Clostridium sp. MB40-C1]WMJ79736.1 ATP-binding cassette domain-containing protein [Clostridium sp. MB40-C1]
MLKVEHLHKKLGDFQLKDINLQIGKGEYFVILGPTGTGKSIILETLAGLYKPDKGKIYFNKVDLTKEYPENRQIGFVYQDYVLFPHLSVKDNIIFGLKQKKLSKNEIKQKLNEVVSMFKIAHLIDRRPLTLSGGEQQRVAIARALITSPKILLMDEPLSSLDPQTKEEFIYMLKSIHQSRKNTVIHVTHDFNEAIYLADKIAVMNEGTIVQLGTPEEIFKKPNSTFVAKFTGMRSVFDNTIEIAK